MINIYPSYHSPEVKALVYGLFHFEITVHTIVSFPGYPLKIVLQATNTGWRPGNEDKHILFTIFLIVPLAVQQSSMISIGS